MRIINAINKIKDATDSQVKMCIRGSSTGNMHMTADEISVIACALGNIGQNRVKYKFCKECLELRMPYNRYYAFMRFLQRHGYNLKAESEVDVMQIIFKETQSN